MSTAFELNTQPRDVFGTNASRRLRRAERGPAMVYGAGKDNEALLLDHNEIMHNLNIEAFHSAIISLNTTSCPKQEIMREVILGVDAEDDTPEESRFRKKTEKDVAYFEALGKEIGKPVEFNWTLEMPDPEE